MRAPRHAEQRPRVPNLRSSRNDLPRLRERKLTVPRIPARRRALRVLPGGLKIGYRRSMTHRAKRLGAMCLLGPGSARGTGTGFRRASRGTDELVGREVRRTTPQARVHRKGSRRTAKHPTSRPDRKTTADTHRHTPLTLALTLAPASLVASVLPPPYDEEFRCLTQTTS
jgi:hypothetical protein